MGGRKQGKGKGKGKGKGPYCTQLKPSPSTDLQPSPESSPTDFSDVPMHEEYLRRRIQQQLRVLKWEHKSLLSLEIELSSSKRATKEQQCALLRKPLVRALIQQLTLLLGIPCAPLPSSPVHALCFQSSQVEPLDKGRYLCISLGFMTCCLDLKQSRDESNDCPSSLQPQMVTSISTFNLADENIPVSMGVFKLGSHVYMVGGQEFPGLPKTPPYLWDLWLIDVIYNRYGVKGTSRDTYHLSVADSSLSLCECNFIGPLNKPKIWPIVEKIDDKVHVIESFPDAFHTNESLAIATHEVLHLNDLKRGWIELSPLCSPDDENKGMRIWNHIVVGHLIYAMLHNSQGFVVYDSKLSKWVLHCKSHYKVEGPSFNPFSIGHVWQILSFGSGRCVGKFPRTEVRDDPLYILIALGCDDSVDVIAVAYLVTLNGQVLCFQKLPHIAEGFDWSFDGVEGRVINIDEDGETWCAVFQGLTYHSRKHFIFVSTFTLEEVAEANAVVEDLRSLICDEDEFGKFPVATEKTFVNVCMKEKHVYTKEVDPGEVYITSMGATFPLPGMYACFM